MEETKAIVRPLEQINDLDQVGLYIDVKEKELQEAIRSRETVEAARYNLQKEVIDLEIAIKNKRLAKIELDKALSKSKANCMTLALEVKRASQKYWNLKPR